MSNSKPDFDLDQFFPYRAVQLGERISHTLSAIYSRRFQLSVPEWRVLACVCQDRPFTAKAVCEVTDLEKATVSRAVRRLEERGLIRRTPLPEDQRAQVLSLTDAGSSLMKELLPLAYAWEGRLLEALSGQELRDFQNIIAKLNRQLTRMARE